MNSMKSALATLVCSFALLGSQARADTNLPFGQVTTGTISSVAQSNMYSFAANAADVLNFTVVATSGSSLFPCIYLYNPASQLVDSAPSVLTQDVDIYGYKVLTSGTYSLLIKDCEDTGTGSYSMCLQKTNKPAGAVPLPFAQVQSGEIGSVAQSNAYTFIANANDVLNFTLVAAGGSSLFPCIYLYNSAGTLLDSAPSVLTQDVEMNGYKVPANGTYNVLIKDCEDKGTGGYWIFVQKMNDPINSVPIPYDQEQTGKIGSVAQTNAYTIVGEANDILNFTVVAASGSSLFPCIYLYNSAGKQLDSAPSVLTQDVEMNGYRVPANGAYNVFIKDCEDRGTGSYTLSIECIGSCPSPQQVPPPEFSPDGGTYFAPLSVKITDPGATIYYTTNGSTPTSSSTRYSTPIPVSSPKTIEAIAVESGYTNSEIAKASYTFMVATPVFTPPGGTYTLPQMVKIADTTPGAAIYYTTNGSTPTSSKTDEYSGPITVSSTETIKAIAVAAGYTNSAVATASYTSMAAPPMFSPSGGTYTSVQTVTLTDKTMGAVIYYTTNGSMPQEIASDKYLGPILVTARETIRAIVVAPGYSRSIVAEAAYTIIGSPSALAAPATKIGTSAATLNAIVNTNGLSGSCLFEYGTNSSRLDKTPCATALAPSATAVGASSALKGLASKTKYYYYVVVTTTGGSASGAVLSFTTE